MILVNEKFKNVIKDNQGLDNRISFYSSDKIREIIKQANKEKINKIYLYDGKNEEILLKIKNRWFPFSQFVLNLSFAYENNLSLYTNIDFDTRIKKDSKENADLIYLIETNKFIYKNEVFVKKIFFLLEDTLVNKIEKYESRAFFYSTSKISEEKFQKFKNEALNEEHKHPGIPLKSSSISGNILRLRMSNSYSQIVYDDGMIKILSFSAKGSFARNNHYNRALNTNIINNAKEITTNPKKISKNNIIQGIIGIVVIVFLSYFTFGHIFGTGNLDLAFLILGDKTTWTHPWVYILVANFIVTFFYTFFMMFVLATFTSAKVNMKQRWNLFLSMQIRQIALFITGNFIIATAIWAMYMNYRSGIRTSALIGTMSMMGILRSIFQVAMAFIFLVPGTVYLSDMFVNPLMAIPVFILGWGGLFWSSMHNVITSSVVFIPSVQNIYVKVKTNIFLKKNNNTAQLSKVNSEVFFLSQGFQGVFKDKNKLFSMMLMTVGMTFFEAIETVIIFQIVEDFYTKSPAGPGPLLGTTGHYWNLFGIAGVRLMSTYVHMFPLLNVIPGQGVGITDLFMSNVNVMVVAKQHGITASDLSSLSDGDYGEISQYANSATIITRFMNFYLKKILSLFITIVIVIKITIKQIRNKERNIKRV